MDNRSQKGKSGDLFAALFIICSITFLIYLASPFTAVFLALFGLFFGFICLDMARSRGRSMGAGMLGGYFFGLLSVIYYMIAGDTIDIRVRKEEEARERYHASKRE